MERAVEMPLGVVVERRAIEHPWQRWRWRAVSVIPGAAAVDGWRELVSSNEWAHFHAATLPLRLFRTETEAYRTNLSAQRPAVYVVLRRAVDGAADEREYEPFLVTASPYEAQDYLDTGEELVEGVTMPDAVIAWVQAFVDRHHVEEPFRKRRRDRADPDETGGRRWSRMERRPNGRGDGRFG